jgi:release factor glutamine methyltransferase
VAFAVDARALIPRPETEVLVDLALGAIAERLGRAPRPPGTPPLTVADVGTGSGAIAVALAVALRGGCSASGDRRLRRVRLAADLARTRLPGGGRPRRSPRPTCCARRTAGGLLVVPDQFDVVCANLPYIPSAIVPSLWLPRPSTARRARRGPDGSR